MSPTVTAGVGTTELQTTPSPSPTATVAASPSATPAPRTISVSCKTGVAATSLLLIGRHPIIGSLLYEVSDPTHPKLVCRITGTSVRILSSDSIAYLKPVSSAETDVMIRSLETGSERTAAQLAFTMPDDLWQTISWRPDGSLAAFSVQPTEGNPGSDVTVWLYAAGAATTLTTYPYRLPTAFAGSVYPIRLRIYRRMASTW